MVTLLIIIAIIIGIIAIAVIFVIVKANSFKNKVEDSVIDGVKEAIIKHGPDAVKYVSDRVKKNRSN
jgi:nitrogen fixation-related uncharacterized protein